MGLIVGGYYDRNSVEHGFIYRGSDKFLSFDYPDALSTRLSGINNRGLICGVYMDSVAGALSWIHRPHSLGWRGVPLFWISSGAPCASRKDLGAGTNCSEQHARDALL
jgi:hypothetical protein